MSSVPRLALSAASAHNFPIARDAASVKKLCRAKVPNGSDRHVSCVSYWHVIPVAYTRETRSKARLPAFFCGILCTDPILEFRRYS